METQIVTVWRSFCRVNASGPSAPVWRTSSWPPGQTAMPVWPRHHPSPWQCSRAKKERTSSQFFMSCGLSSPVHVRCRVPWYTCLVVLCPLLYICVVVYLNSTNHFPPALFLFFVVVVFLSVDRSHAQIQLCRPQISPQQLSKVRWPGQAHYAWTAVSDHSNFTGSRVP